MIKEYLKSLLNAEGEEFTQNILIRELEDSFGLSDMIEFLFFNENLSDDEKIEKILRDIEQSNKNIENELNCIELKLKLTEKILLLSDKTIYIEDVWLAIEEDELNIAQEKLNFQFSSHLNWFYSNFMSLDTLNFELYGFNQNGTVYSDGEHPIIKLNKERTSCSKILIARWNDDYYWIDEKDNIYVKTNETIQKTGLNFLLFLVKTIY